MELDFKNDSYCKILMSLLIIGKIGPNEFRGDLEKYEIFLRSLGK